MKADSYALINDRCNAGKAWDDKSAEDFHLSRQSPMLHPHAGSDRQT
jgi:hypothetical protein